VGRRQREHAEALDAVLPDERHLFESCFDRRVGDDERLLRLDHPARRRVRQSRFRAGRERHAPGIEEVPPDDSPFGVVEHEGDEVEAHDALELRRQPPEQLLGLATRRDRFGHGHQGLETIDEGKLVGRRDRRRRCRRIALHFARPHPGDGRSAPAE
jgi:hypothetical protein